MDRRCDMTRGADSQPCSNTGLRAGGLASANPAPERDEMTLAVIGEAPAKPAFGEPCNGCGVCCALELCKYARCVHGDGVPAPCPSLIFHSGRYWCGLRDLATPEFLPAFDFGLGIGVGCDSNYPVGGKIGLEGP